MLSKSHEFGTGAPVVAYGNIPARQFGATETVITPDGKTYDMQYAVVQADSVLASHDANGMANQDYYSDDASKIRAITGNGRTAGIQLAYQQGTGKQYHQDLLHDHSHGISPDVIKTIQKPILVRVMQPKDITPEMGEKTNIASGISMSQTERANNDRERIGDFSAMKYHDNGDPTRETLMQFISRMPVQEQGELISRNGNPSIQALNRFNAAVISAAYENDALTEMMTEAIDPESKNILSGLQKAAGAVERLSRANNNYDVRPLIVQAVSKAIDATGKGISLMEASHQRMLMESSDDDEASGMILQMFAENSRFPNRIAQKLRTMAERLEQEAHPKTEMFGEVLQMPTNAVIQKTLAEDSKRIPRHIELWKKEGTALIRDLLSDSGTLSEDARKFMRKLNAM